MYSLSCPLRAGRRELPGIRAEFKPIDPRRRDAFGGTSADILVGISRPISERSSFGCVSVDEDCRFGEARTLA